MDVQASFHCFSSKFYPVSLDDNAFLHGFHSSFPLEERLFEDTADLDFPEDLVRRLGRRSLQNRLEAVLVEHLVRQLPTTTVSVLAAYGAQVGLLGEVVHEAKVLEREQLRKSRAFMIRQWRGFGACKEPFRRAFKGLLQEDVLKSSSRCLRLRQGIDPLRDEPHPRLHTVDSFQALKSREPFTGCFCRGMRTTM